MFKWSRLKVGVAESRGRTSLLLTVGIGDASQRSNLLSAAGVCDNVRRWQHRLAVYSGPL